MFNQLRLRLANRIHPIDLVAFTRSVLKGVSTKNLESYNAMAENDKRNFEADASLVFKNKTFNAVLDELIQAQIQFAIREAHNMDEVLFARATINGLELIREEFAKLNSEYEQHLEQGARFNKFDILDSVFYE
jgi:hypothetical protein